MNDIFVADGEADAPTWHVVAFGKREELYPNLLGSGYLKKTRRSIAVKCEIGVCQVVDYDQVVLLGKLDDALKKVQFDDFSGRIMGETDDQHFRLGPGLLDGFFEMAEKVLTGNKRNATKIPSGQNHRILVNRISRAGAQHHVAGIDGGPS